MSKSNARVKIAWLAIVIIVFAGIGAVVRMHLSVQIDELSNEGKVLCKYLEAYRDEYGGYPEDPRTIDNEIFEGVIIGWDYVKCSDDAFALWNWRGFNRHGVMIRIGNRWFGDHVGCYEIDNTGEIRRIW